MVEEMPQIFHNLSKQESIKGDNDLCSSWDARVCQQTLKRFNPIKHNWLWIPASFNIQYSSASGSVEAEPLEIKTIFILATFYDVIKIQRLEMLNGKATNMKRLEMKFKFYWNRFSCIFGNFRKTRKKPRKTNEEKNVFTIKIERKVKQWKMHKPRLDKEKLTQIFNQSFHYEKLVFHVSENAGKKIRKWKRRGWQATKPQSSNIK